MKNPKFYQFNSAIFVSGVFNGYILIDTYENELFIIKNELFFISANEI